MLLALTLAAHVHELIALSLASVIKKQDCWRFILPIHDKNSRPIHPGREISFYAYHEDPRLCAVTCLEEYVKKTEKRRGDDQLLISYKAPNKTMGSQTLSRWLYTVLTKAGVSMAFTGHSTRSASTSEVANSGIPMELILKTADWSSANVFKKHYHNATDDAFSHALLSVVSHR